MHLGNNYHMLKKVFHSEQYIGEKKKNHFEGWYFKTETKGKIFSFIVGVSRARHDSHAFIQYIDCDVTHCFRFSLNDFFFNNDKMTINVAGNLFSIKGINCNLKDGKISIKANLKFGKHQSYKKTTYSPSVMGPFSYLPMSCSHVIVSMSHSVTGTITINSKAINIDDGLGYIEKDFGKNFPKNYFWVQGQNKEISLMFAFAYPLIFGMKGFICIVSAFGEQYNFSLYTGAKLTVKQFSKDRCEILIRKKDCTLKFIAEGGEAPQQLASPIEKGEMCGTIKEDVCGTISGTLNIKKAGLVFNVPAAYEFNITKIF